MRVSLVNPGSGRLGKYEGLFVAPPLNLAYIASAIQDVAEVDIIDCYALEMKMDECIKRVVKNNPDIVAVIPNDYCDYVIKGFDEWTRIFFSHIKYRCDATTVAGGPYAMTIPKETLEYADFILMGDQDVVFRHLVNAIKNSKSVRGINGIGFMNKRTPCIRRPLYTKNIDSVPFPSRNLLQGGLYRHVFVPRPMTTIQTSRGCPHRCIYCTRGVYGPHRERSPDNVIRELQEIREKNIIIYDDTFTHNKKRILELCNKIIKEGIDIRWVCSTRTDAVSRDLLKRMNQAGCFMIAYGVESGDQQILNNLHKGISVKETENALRMTRLAGIKSVAYMLLGSPGETAESVERGIALLERTRPEYVQFNPITVYPGSELYNRNEFISGKRIHRVQKILYRRYYMRLGYISRQARSIRSLYDLKSAIDGFRFIIS